MHTKGIVFVSVVYGGNEAAVRASRLVPPRPSVAWFWKSQTARGLFTSGTKYLAQERCGQLKSLPDRQVDRLQGRLLRIQIDVYGHGDPLRPAAMDSDRPRWTALAKLEVRRALH